MTINRTCYGLASVFCVDSSTCKNCEAFASCLDEVLQTLKQCSGGLDVTELLAQHLKNKERLNPQPPDKEKLDTLFNPLIQLQPAKDKTKKPNLDGKSELVCEWFEQCWKAGLRSPNKFEDSLGVCTERLRKIPPFVSLTLLAIRAGFSNKNLLVKELWSRTKLTKEKFKENFKTAIEVLKLLGLIEENGNDYTLRS